MRSTAVALAALFSLASAQSAADLPTCSTQCFVSAIGNSNCGLTDTYCQCTSPNNAQISSDVISCLCDSTCSESELAKVQSVSDALCSQALEAKGETYTATTAGADACGATGAAGGSSGGSSAAASSAAPMSSMAAASSSGAAAAMPSSSASMSAAMQQTGNAAAPVATQGLGAVLGAVGLGLMAL